METSGDSQESRSTVVQGRADVVIDRASPVPLYFQIARQLEAAITSGTLRPGDRLEGDLELVQRLAVSRPTVRQAMDWLVDQGLVMRHRGLGTVVVPRQVRRPVELTSLYDDLVGEGRDPTTMVLRMETSPASETVAQALGLPLGTPVLALERLRSADGQPLGIMRNYLPADRVRVERDDLERRGLYDVLRSQGRQPRMAEQTIGARLATAEEARLLEGRRPLPVLTMARTSFDGSGQTIEYAKHSYRADRYSFRTSLVTR
ncbi:MAG: GntR family transcriptional regulator [Acidimicrobiales bacterium]